MGPKAGTIPLEDILSLVSEGIDVILKGVKG